jgi:hypothetical protein
LQRFKRLPVACRRPHPKGCGTVSGWRPSPPASRSTWCRNGRACPTQHDRCLCQRRWRGGEGHCSADVGVSFGRTRAVDRDAARIAGALARCLPLSDGMRVDVHCRQNIDYADSTDSADDECALLGLLLSRWPIGRVLLFVARPSGTWGVRPLSETGGAPNAPRRHNPGQGCRLRRRSGLSASNERPVATSAFAAGHSFADAAAIAPCSR